MQEQGQPALEVVLTKLHAGGKFGGERLQGLRRPARRRRLRRQRALRVARRRGPPRRQGLPPGVRARRPAGRRWQVVGERDATPARRSRSCPTPRSSRRSTSTPRRSRSGCARPRSSRAACASSSSTSAPTARRSSSTTRAASATSSRYLNETKEPIHQHIVYFEGESERGHRRGGDAVERSYQESVFSFANNINTIEGGTHLRASAPR